MKMATPSKKNILAYGIGAIPFGIKDHGFSSLLMIYFNQVLGLPAYLVGISLLIVMVIDAAMDPWIGHVSDRWSSRIGRRHPFMYASVLPISLSFYFLWVPPMMSEIGLFVYLTCMAVVVRVVISFFEVPNSAMLGEITNDYDRRTSITGLQYMIGAFGWVGMALLTYLIFLPDTTEYTPGLLNPAGYERYAFWASIFMATCILISALGTQRLAMNFTAPNTESVGYKTNLIKSVSVLFQQRSFRSLFFASLLTNLLTGVANSIQLYFAIYFFGFSTPQIALITLSLIVAVIVAYVSSVFILRGLEKKVVAIWMTWLALFFSVSPVLAKYWGFLPANGTQSLLYIVLILTCLSSTALLILNSFKHSMAIDLVEANQIRSKHRGDGILLATYMLTRKVFTGLGLFVSGCLLSLGEQSGDFLSETGMNAIVLPYVLLFVVFYGLSVWFLSGFGVTRRDFLSSLEQLKQL